MTLSTKLLAGALITGLAASAASAHAKAGDLMVRLRAIDVIPNEDSSGITPAWPTDKVSVDNSIMPEIDFTYMATDNIGFELIAATTKHSVSGKTGTPAAVGKLASAWVLPPTLTAQYHFMPEGQIRPYVGAGINYTLFYNEKASSGLESAVGSTKVSLDDSFGYALQAGADVQLQENLFLNLDIKYIDMSTTATLTTTGAGVQKVDVDLNPIVLGVGLGMVF